MVAWKGGKSRKLFRNGGCSPKLFNFAPVLFGMQSRTVIVLVDGNTNTFSSDHHLLPGDLESRGWLYDSLNLYRQTLI